MDADLSVKAEDFHLIASPPPTFADCSSRYNGPALGNGMYLETTSNISRLVEASENSLGAKNK